MSVKNQRTLFIAAFAIILLTVITLFGVNYAVDRISNIKPPSMVMTPPSMPPGMMGTDDALNKMRPPNMPKNGMPPPSFDDQARGFGQDRRPPPEVLRRMRNGRDAPDMRRMEPPNGTRDDAVNKSATPPPRRDMGMPPTGQDPRGFDPGQREMMEQEMERRREFYDNGPPPGYYPPPGYDDYEGGPPMDDNYYDYYNDYYYDQNFDLEGRRHDDEDDDVTTAKLDTAMAPNDDPSLEDEDFVQESDE